MTIKLFSSKILADGALCFIEVPFDPRPVFGKQCAAVKVTLNGHRYRSTIEALRGDARVPLNRTNREAAGVRAGETVTVKLELDTEAPETYPPTDLVLALNATPPAWERWTEMSPDHQREHVTALAQAKRPETRAKRIAEVVVLIAERPARKAK